VRRVFRLFVCIFSSYSNTWARGGVVVKALRYKPAGRGFDSRWCHWNFSVTESFRSHYGPGVDSASNRNEYQVYFFGVKADGGVRLPLQACNGTALPLDFRVKIQRPLGLRVKFRVVLCLRMKIFLPRCLRVKI
jgi:hypothetical protein